jgi:hypothetical protein
MRPPPDLLAFFLEPKEDSWSILKAFFQRDGDEAKIQPIPQVQPAARPRALVEFYS